MTLKVTRLSGHRCGLKSLDRRKLIQHCRLNDLSSYYRPQCRTELCFHLLMVKAADSRAVDLGSVRDFPMGLFPGRIIGVTKNVALQWLPCQVPAVIGSALELVGLVSALSN